MKLVKVTWIDSGLHLSDDGWAPIETYVAKAIAADTTVETVGFLIHEDENMVVVGLSHDAYHGAIFGAQVIHRVGVRSIEDLHEIHPVYTGPMGSDGQL